MTILYFFSFRNSIESWYGSGILYRELEIFKLLNSKYGHKFIFVTYGDIDDKKYIDNLNYITLISYGSLFKEAYKIKFLNTLLIPFKLKQLQINFDLIQQNQLNGSWVAIFTKIIFKKPLFIRTGYSMYKFSILENKSFLKVSLYKILTVISVLFSNVYSVSSQTELEDFNKKSNKYRSKVNLLRNWSNSISSKPFLSRYDNKIICVGRLVPQKNYTKLLHDFKNSKDEFEIDIVGTGNDQEVLKTLSEKLGVKVNFLGRIENSVLKTLYQDYKYFVNCSEFEGNPKSTIEAMGAGCLVLASNIDNHKELINNYEDGILFDLEKSNIKDLIKSISNGRAKDISTNAINKVNKSFKIEKILEDYNQIYISLSK